MLLFRKLVDETQISKPQEYTDTFRQILTSIFLSVRAILKETVQYETPCNRTSLENKWMSFSSRNSALIYLFNHIRFNHFRFDNFRFRLHFRLDFFLFGLFNGSFGTFRLLNYRFLKRKQTKS